MDERIQCTVRTSVYWPKCTSTTKPYTTTSNRSSFTYFVNAMTGVATSLGTSPKKSAPWRDTIYLVLLLSLFINAKVTVSFLFPSLISSHNAKIGWARQRSHCQISACCPIDPTGKPLSPENYLKFWENAELSVSRALANEQE